MSKNKTILQALMSLDIGGAETHVIEQSIELVRRGYKVIVVSNGGAYESVLKDNGVEVYNIPLHTKNPIAVLKSIRLLYKIIKKENIKLVHAHARIPAFILSLLKNVLDFHLVTTAHGVFHVNAILKVITRWGEKVFAVSQDIKNYLLDNYDLNEKDIYMTINGINLDRYKPQGIPERNTILHISRLEPTTSLVAKLLIDYGRKNKLQEIIIVGDGQELDNLEKLAMDVDNVHFVGKSTDVITYLNKAKIFVGISRAALEAMSFNLPIILAGDYGYMGILTEDKLETAEFNNFTARGFEKPTLELLNRDLDLLLNSETNYDCSWEREYINEKYSVEIMVDKYEEVYKHFLGD